MIRSGSPAACASIVEMIRSNRIVPSPSRPSRRPAAAYTMLRRTIQRCNPFPENTRATPKRARPRAPGTPPPCFLTNHRPPSPKQFGAARRSFGCKLAAWLRSAVSLDDAPRCLTSSSKRLANRRPLLDERAALALAAGDAHGRSAQRGRAACQLIPPQRRAALRPCSARAGGG